MSHIPRHPFLQLPLNLLQDLEGWLEAWIDWNLILDSAWGGQVDFVGFYKDNCQQSS